MHDIPLRLALLAFKYLQDTPRSVIWTWDIIKGFGSSKALKTSYLFLFAVPVLARALVYLPETITVPFWGKTFELALSLPFSWVLLFASACFASIGNGIYSMLCPELIQKFPDYPSFAATQRDGTYLQSPVRRIALVPANTNIEGQIDYINNAYNRHAISIPHLASVLRGEELVQPSDFYFVRDSASLSLPMARLIASLAYFAAFACLLIIAAQNIVYVIQYLDGFGAASGQQHK